MDRPPDAALLSTFDAQESSVRSRLNLPTRTRWERSGSNTVVRYANPAHVLDAGTRKAAGPACPLCAFLLLQFRVLLFHLRYRQSANLPALTARCSGPDTVITVLQSRIETLCGDRAATAICLRRVSRLAAGGKEDFWPDPMTCGFGVP